MSVEQRAWAQHCGCDGACKSLTFNDDMELVDVRTRLPNRRKRVQAADQSPRAEDRATSVAGDEVEAPVLLLHLLLLG